jgi:hypothetical protein
VRTKPKLLGGSDAIPGTQLFLDCSGVGWYDNQLGLVESLSPHRVLTGVKAFPCQLQALMRSNVKYFCFERASSAIAVGPDSHVWYDS